MTNAFDQARDRIRDKFADDGLSATDCSGIIKGNQDIGCPEWLPNHVNPSAANLPGEEHKADWTEYYAEMFRNG